MNYNLVAEEKAICQEGDLSATDNYFNLQDINKYCQEGTNIMVKKGGIPWNRGIKLSVEHKLKIAEAMAGFHPETEFKNGHQINKGRTPWNKGIKGVQVAWCKGKRMSEIACKRMSAAKKGKPSLFKGKHHTTETIQKMIKAHSNISKDTRKKISESLKGKQSPWRGKTGRYSQGILQKMSESRRGKTAGSKHPQWKGGISFEPYCPKFNEELKEKIRERDGRVCQLCSTKENGRKLSVHHIHYDKENCAPDLISLCVKCNSKVNINCDYYENLFMEKLRARGLLL